MGEIADALKKSRARLSRTPEVEAPKSESDPGSHAEALRRSRAESADLGDAGSPVAPIQPAVFSGHYIRVESHRHLAVHILSAMKAFSTRSLAVVSGLRNEGKTTVACNLAAAMASLANERDVAIVDLDLRNPNVHRWLGLRPRLGVESFLQGEAELKDVCIRLENPDLDVYPAVISQRMAHELLVTPTFGSLIRHLEATYRTVLVDTPPCLMVPDASLIMQQISACTLVARVGQSRVRRLRDALETLPAERQLGTILNGTTLPSHRRDYEYYAAEETDDEVDQSEES